MSQRQPEDGLSQNLADNIRWIRERRGLTQQKLASLCALPRSTLSHLETGAANPTLSVLVRLASALQLSVEELLSAPRARFRVFPSGTLPIRSRARGRAEVRKLLPYAVPGMEIDRFELAAGAKLTGVPHRPGTHEYLYCERGQLTVRTGGERLLLNRGDVAAFPGDLPHSYESSGRAASVGFGVVSLSPIGSQEDGQTP